MYVSSSMDQNMHFGKFKDLDQSKFKYQDPKVCRAGNIKGELEATITHANPNRVKLNMPFKFELSKNEMLRASEMQINVVIASLDPGKKGAPRWQHLKNVPLMQDKNPEKQGRPYENQKFYMQKIFKCYPKSLVMF